MLNRNRQLISCTYLMTSKSANPLEIQNTTKWLSLIVPDQNGTEATCDDPESRGQIRMLSLKCEYVITKTCLFKYIENFTTKK